MRFFQNKTLSSFLSLLLIVASSFHSTEAKMARPHKLLIYYGYPSLVHLVTSEGTNNADGNTETAAKIFSNWDYVVFGANLEFQDHDDHDNTVQIIAGIHQKNTRSKIFGYVTIDATIQNEPLEKIESRVEGWKAMGVDGIFLDNAGYDFQVSRKRLNSVVKLIHDQNLSAFVNAWRSEDILDSKKDSTWNPGAEPSLLGLKDFYLLESFIVNTDAYPTHYAPLDVRSADSDVAGRIKSALRYRKTRHIKLMSIGMADFAAFDEQALDHFFRMQEAAGLLFSLDGYGLTTTDFSASGKAQNTVRLFSSSPQNDRFFTKNPRYRINTMKTEIQRTNGSIRLMIDEAGKQFSYFVK